MAPLFSIITVTYNAANDVRRTAESVAGQSCELYEHIIMDGASTDATINVARSVGNPRMRLYSEPDKGIYDAMNKAMSKAKGEYLIFLNAGDTFASLDTLQHMANTILDNDYPGIVYGQTQLVDREGRILGKRHLDAPEKLTLDSFKHGMVVCHQAMAVLSKVTGFYDLKYKYSADYEWCIKCLQHSKKNVYMPEVLIDYLSEGLTTAHHKESLIERFKIMCIYYGTAPTIIRHLKFALRYLKRRRQASNIQ